MHIIRRKKTIWFLLVLMSLYVLTACRSDGFQGRAYVREPDGGIGPEIRGVSLSFTREDGSNSYTTTTDENGRYRIGLTPARYYVTANHLAYETYDSSPGFFVVTEDGGFQTGNVFLDRLDATVILLVRHAEKASNEANTNLDPDENDLGIGLSRAEVLGDIAADSGVTSLYTTKYCRTAQTGQPAADLLNLTMQIIPTSDSNAGLTNCTPSITAATTSLPNNISTTTAVAQHILTNHAGEVVLVVGHSNTVPQLVEAFGAPSVCPTHIPLMSGNCWIAENEFNHLFVVTVPTGTGTPTVTHELYGAS